MKLDVHKDCQQKPKANKYIPAYILTPKQRLQAQYFCNIDNRVISTWGVHESSHAIYYYRIKLNKTTLAFWKAICVNIPLHLCGFCIRMWTRRNCTQMNVLRRRCATKLLVLWLDLQYKAVLSDFNWKNTMNLSSVGYRYVRDLSCLHAQFLSPWG